MGDTAAVATAVIATEPPPLLVATPPAATPQPGPLVLRVSPDLERVVAAQSDPPPEIRERTPTAETNNYSVIPDTTAGYPSVFSPDLVSSMLYQYTLCCLIC